MAWLAGWDHRRKITISNTNVDAVLSNFPVLVYISASSGTGSADLTDIFTEIGSDANRKKIAITTSDGETECYVEIERFDYANSVAWLWVKVPSVSDSTETELYIYYDSSHADNTAYIGDIADTPAQSVWDSDFKLVMHMAQDPNGDAADAMKDSTANANHGTPSGSMTSADLVDGEIGKCIDFDGTDDCIDLSGITTGDNNTISFLIKFSVNGPDTYIFDAETGRILIGLHSSQNTISYHDGTDWHDSSLVVADSVWHNVTIVTKSDGSLQIYVDNNAVYNTSITANIVGGSAVILGSRYTKSADYFVDGLIDEFRISNTDRSADWIKASRYSNQDGLIAYGNAEGPYISCPAPFSATATMQSVPQIELLSNIFIATSSMSVGEIFSGALVECPSPFSAQASLQSNLQIDITQNTFTTIGTLQGQPELQIFTGGSLIATGSISATITDPFSVAILPRVYTFTLTGADDGVDDIIIPIKSFQSRLKSGDPTYLSIVIPGTDYASEINLRLNGDLIVRMGYLSNSEIILSEIISIVDFENIVIYEGTINKTITLDGHRTETFISKEINLTGSSYRNLTAGKLRYRCTPNLYVRPGDYVNIDDDSFTIENITYSVSPGLETFEVSE